MSNLSKLKLIFCLVVIGAIAAGCGANTKTTETKTGTTGPALFKVVDQNGKETGLSMNDLKALPLATVTIDYKVQGGPTVKSVLKKVGITSFKQVVIRGKDGTECTLTIKQCDSKSILDFTNRGTVKLSTTYIPKAKWAKDITKITVK